MSGQEPGLSPEEMEALEVTALPDKEVVSILDLNADLNLAIDAAAPIDLAVAANANVAAPIDAAVGANVLSVGSQAGAAADQGVLITQGIHADATAHSVQDSGIQQGADTTGTTDGTTTTDPTAGTTDPTGATTGTTSDLANGNLLNVNVNVDGNAAIAAPINGAVAANANVAAPIDASVAANVGSIDSNAVSVAQQTAIVDQQIDGSAGAVSDQSSNISQ
ncbi:MAG: peptidoglycan-binding protein [Oryzihumus sp.]